MPWQRYVADVAGELDDNGLRRYDTVVIIVPRQNGKTTLIEPHLLTVSTRPDATGAPTRRIALYLAQDRQLAREKLIVELEGERMSRNLAYRGNYTVRRSNGSERITWTNRPGRIMVQASTNDAGHSLTVDDVVLDEAWAHRDLSIVNGVQPTMQTRPDPQLWVVSTPGDGDDGLLQHYQELGEASLSDPDTRIAYFEWSATSSDDRADPAVWRRVMPALGITITEDRIRSYLSTTPPAEFDRAYLARRPAVDTVAALSIADWWACAHPDPDTVAPTGPLVAAFDVNLDRTYTTLAVAGAFDGRTGVVVLREPGTAWVPGALLELAHRPGITLHAVVADRRSGTGGIIDACLLRGLPAHELGTGDVASATGTMVDVLAEQMLWHASQTVLDDAVTGSRRRPLGEAWAYAKQQATTDSAPIIAATYAVAGYRSRFPVL